jgi:hypothetical protein
MIPDILINKKLQRFQAHQKNSWKSETVSWFLTHSLALLFSQIGKVNGLYLMRQDLDSPVV